MSRTPANTRQHSTLVLGMGTRSGYWKKRTAEYQVPLHLIEYTGPEKFQLEDDSFPFGAISAYFQGCFGLVFLGG